MKKLITRLAVSILTILAMSLALYFKTDVDKTIVITTSCTIITLLILSVTVKWSGSFNTLVYSTLGGIFALIGLSIVHPTDFIWTLGTVLIASVLGLAITFMIVLPIYSLFFEFPKSKKWYISRGKHYSSGWKGRIFFFKREFEFWYRLDADALQVSDLNNEGQWNKICGISSVIHRWNSIRKVFRYTKSAVEYDDTNYQYDKFKKVTETQLENIEKRSVGDWVHVKLKAPRLIWMGYWHYPYHGGVMNSTKTYYIDVRLSNPHDV